MLPYCLICLEFLSLNKFNRIILTCVFNNFINMDIKINFLQELKMDFESPNSICRCCLSTDRRMFGNDCLSSYLKEFTGVNMETFDSLPLLICYECSAYLLKAIKFKQRVLKAHTMLYEYVTRCAPFPMDARDPELNKHASPILRSTPILTLETNGKGKQGSKVFTHKKEPVQSELDVEIAMLNAEFKHEIKEDVGFSDYDDNIPLEEISANIAEYNEKECDIVKEDDHSIDAKKRKRKKKEVPTKKRKRMEESEEDRRKCVKRIEIDPTKIRTIILNPEEQIKMRMEESKASLKFPYQCQLCYKGFNFESKLMNHMQKHQPSRGPYECSTCKMYLPTVHSYNMHRLIHTQRYECVACNRRMIDKMSIIDHYRSQHEGLTSIFTCQLCGKVSTNGKTHRGHMRNHHAVEGRPKCDRCGKTFVNKDSLQSHMLIHEGVKDYECGICGAKFRTRTQMKGHHYTHSEERQYYCVECDTRFKTAQGLKTHLKNSIKHIDIENLKFPCLRCEKRFHTEALLSHHNLIQHEGIRGHRCDICGAALATSYSLTKHIQTVHKGKKAEAKHICDTCGRAFRGKSALVNHVRTHTGEKPFSCDICGKRFAQRTAMRTHVKFIHLKERRRTRVKLRPSPEPRDNKYVQMFPKEENPVYETWQEPQNCDVFYQIETN